MANWAQRVADWNKRAGVKRIDEGLTNAEQYSALRLAVDLIDEEIGETKAALNAWTQNRSEALVGIADGIGDSIVVLCGLAYRLGIPLAAVMEEILASNDSKLIGGVQYRADGKILKGPHYKPPDLPRAMANALAAERALEASARFAVGSACWRCGAVFEKMHICAKQGPDVSLKNQQEGA
jgi:hypothetical protein